MTCDENNETYEKNNNRTHITNNATVNLTNTKIKNKRTVWTRTNRVQKYTFKKDPSKIY